MNKLVAVRPIWRSLISSNAVPLQRMYSGAHAPTKGPLFNEAAPSPRVYDDPQDRPGSLNDVPQPEGDWEENYHKKQSKYNAALAGAAIFFVGTLTYILQSEVLFFNAFPPDTYE